METIYIISNFILLILLFIITNNRSKAYKVTIVDFNTNDKAIFIVKTLSKAKAYEVVSKSLLKNKIEGTIIDVCNICYMTNNTILNL